VQFVEQDILEPWPVESATIDLVVGSLVLEHIREVRPVFAEAARVLRKGGKMFLSELHPMRQLQGAQAHAVDAQTGARMPVPAFRHSISEFVNSALAAGFVLRSMGEWVEEGAGPDATPRLLTLSLVRQAS
jgi:malonyl-CoA O-methyltransferase